MQRFKTFITTIAAVLALGMPALVPATAAAVCPGPDDTSSKEQVLRGVGTAGGSCDEGAFNRRLKAAVTIISTIAGIVAVIMIILAGFKYITSGGASDKVASAKNSLIYALIGVAIVALSQFLIHFVLSQAKQATEEPDKKKSSLEIRRPWAA